LLIAAAFVGPGTVTVASKAGAVHGYDLLWAVLFSVVATIILQEMAARLGLITRRGLGDALRGSFVHPVLRWIAIGLVLSAIAVGNAAFQAGNISGAALGWTTLTSGSEGSGHFFDSARCGAIVVAVCAAVLLWIGEYRKLERVLIGLVVVMSLSFLTTALCTGPHLSDIFAGLLRPRWPDQDLGLVMAVIGTTVVPYNLFLHASIVAEKWSGNDPVADLRSTRIDTTVAVGLGGMVTGAIVITAATTLGPGDAMTSAADMARQLEPLFGGAGVWIFAAGMMAAGLTSAITAPLAAAYATCGALGWKPELKSSRFRAIWGVILAIGFGCAVSGWRPGELIIFAQATNGVLLPIIAVYLLWVMNGRVLPPEHRNGWMANGLGGAVVIVVMYLSYTRLMQL
jgi:NRAMP (natural resistance-associated macrophage protein)-like metal ion transporter